MKPIAIELSNPREAKPAWLKMKVPLGTKFSELRHIIDGNRLHTVCEDARCPNVADCWNRGTATFMILGDICTRSCGFCSVKTGRPVGLDLDEPRRVAEAVKEMNLKFAVVTSVNRDELPDGGATIFARTIHAIRLAVPSCRVEVLIPDFQGKADQLRIVLDARPDILNHNVETVPRLYRTVRPQARYQRSLGVLEAAKKQRLTTKTGIMVGLGETGDEVHSVMEDLRCIGVDILTIGQYLQPTKAHLPVQRYVAPDEFRAWKEFGISRGFAHVESGPLVRSSYHAEEHPG
jgi:lipoyl synthase